METTTAQPRTGGRTPAVMEELPQSPAPAALNLDADDALRFVLERRRRQDLAAAEEMQGIVCWADAHRVGAGSELECGALDERTCEQMIRSGSSDGWRSVAGELGTEGQLRLAGEGAHLIAEFAVAELAAALGLSESSARALVGRSVELRDRLPRLWARVMGGELPAWKARQIAAETIPLNPAAAAYVDAQLAPFAHGMSLHRILRAVEAAVLRLDPELAAERARSAAEHRGVWTEDRLDGTTRLEAVVDTPDAAAFDTAVDQVATTLGRLGHDGSRDVRRAAAVGVLADPQYALDLLAGEPTAHRAAPTVHVHLHVDALSGAPACPGDADGGPVARVDRLGARSWEAARRWIADLTPGSRVLLTPVVDTTASISVDAYEVPDRLRDQVGHRDPCCVFPWCERRGRFDVDHIEEFVPPEDGGPPGQTCSENCARLCRFHHRLKTHHPGWGYARLADGSYEWLSPTGYRYVVGSSGTTLLR